MLSQYIECRHNPLHTNLLLVDAYKCNLSFVGISSVEDWLSVERRQQTSSLFKCFNEVHAGDSIISIYLTCKMSKTDFKSSIDLVSLRPVSVHMLTCAWPHQTYRSARHAQVKLTAFVTDWSYVLTPVLLPHMALLDPRPNP